MSTNIIIPTKTGVRKALDNLNFLREMYRSWSYKMLEYRQYGLYHDDIYRDNHDEVGEAVRRLPEDVFTGRVHRLHRAVQLNRAKIYLPEPMWTKIDDKNHNYLTPYLNEITREKLERAAWDKK